MTHIRATIDGRDLQRDEILRWEERRFASAARRIGLDAPTGDLSTRRLAFADDKLALGHDEIRRRLRGSLAASGFVGRATNAIARGHRRTSICDLYVTGGTAGEFVDWFTDNTRPDYEYSMIAANPDHFLIATAPDGRQEVIETTGGSPLPARFFIDYDDDTALTSRLAPEYERDASGVAQDERGTEIGGVRHQFRDADGGFHAHLVVEFPSTMLPSMISQHRRPDSGLLPGNDLSWS
jgi:hypothetical protein